MHSFAAAKPQSAPTEKAPVPKLRIGAANDPLEAEADRAADRVIAGQFAGPLGRATSSGIHRKCAECEAEDERQIRRKERSSTSPAPGGKRAAAATRALSSGGVPLSAADRAYFEPRFGQDFSNVRLHTHSRAASAAAAIHARAYTWQNDIAFASGEYLPGSREGRRLIAHELAHVAQHVPHIARQATTPVTRTYHDDQGGDQLDYTEVVHLDPHPTTAGIEGSVNRSVAIPAQGTTPARQTHRGEVKHIRFTPDCRIVVPYKIFFQQQPQAATAESCQEPPNSTRVNFLSQSEFQSVQNRYIAAMNDGLNNRYGVRVTGCSSAQPCTNRLMPVEIAAEAVTSPPPNADHAIDVVNRGGRADSSTICAAGYNYLTAIHEGGHEALGAPDEYQEYDRRTIARGNRAGLAWERPERVRSDLSAMDDQKSYGRFMLFHERHFRFAQAFLEAVLQGQGCTVSLEPIRSSPAEFRLDLSGGFGGSNRGILDYGSLFVGAGIPLERRRRLLFLIGAHGQAFSSMGAEDQRAFTAGLRIGLEAQTTPSSANLGVSGGLSASAGGLYAPASSPAAWTGLTPSTERFSPYGELGANLNLNLPMFSAGWQVRVGAEGAIGREFSSDPNALQWWRAGFVIGISR